MQTNNNIFSIFDLKTKENMQLYYSLKRKFEYVISDIEREKYYDMIVGEITSILNNYDYVLYPESSSLFIKEIVTRLNKENFEIKKNDINFFIEYAKGLGLQKKELESHLTKISEMGKVFKINHLKATQRKKYCSVLFKKEEYPKGKYLVIEDSLFSGTTLDAIQEVAPDNTDYLTIFAK